MSEAPKTVGVKKTEGYEHNYWGVLTHAFDEDAVEYIRTDEASALLAAKDARIAELEAFLFPYAHNKEISGISWDGKYLIGDKASISAFHSLKNRGEQIDVYKQSYDQNLAAAKTRAEAAEARLSKALEVMKPFADRCEEAVRVDDHDNDGLTVRTLHLRAARAFIEERGE